VDLATVATATGLPKLVKQSGNAAPPSDYNWMVWQVSIWHMISTQNSMEIWFAISTLWLVHCCKTTEKWPTPCVYSGVIFHYSSAYPRQI